MNDKLARALHYLIHLAQERRWPLGTVKLAKSLVLSEAASLYHRERTITRAKIVKAPHGPIPDQFEEHLRYLETAGKIKISEGDQRYEPTGYESLSPPDMSGFDGEELEILADIGETCCKKYTATALSDLTHNYYWKIVGMGEEIPVAAYLQPEDFEGPPMSDEETAQLDQAMREAGLNA